eukprot:gene5388-6061_t
MFWFGVLGLLYAVLVLSFNTATAVISSSSSSYQFTSTCLIKVKKGAPWFDANQENEVQNSLISSNAEEVEQMADPYYRYNNRREFTVQLQVLHRCGRKLCNSYNAKIYVGTRMGKKECGHGKVRSSKLVTIRCRLRSRPLFVVIYWKRQKRTLVVKKFRSGHILRAVMPRQRKRIISHLSLSFCASSAVPRNVTITDTIQGTECPSGRLRYIVGSIQDLRTRTLDGRLNHEKKLFQGARGENLIRLSGNGFADNISVPSGACTAAQRSATRCPFPNEYNGTGSNRPNARVISNFLIAQNKPILNKRGLSDLITYFGQFLDHDTDLVAELPRSEVQINPNDLDLPIPVPKGDLMFDMDSKGNKSIPVRRFAFDKCTGNNSCKCPRETINTISSILDANTVYGSDQTRNNALRTLKDGLLKMDKKNLPLNTFGLPNSNAIHRDPTKLRLAGDVRANVAPTLLALHTLFAREHNRIAKIYKQSNPRATDESIFQYARKLVIAEIQAITFREYLPSLVGGTRRIPKYTGYNPKIDSTIATEFSNAAFRFGHSQVSTNVFRYEKNGAVSKFGHLLLRDGFFRPDRVTQEGGIEPILRGAIKHLSQEVDMKVVDELRNFLFQAGGVMLDLAAINIQRSRETGIPDYNTVRAKLGLKKRASFYDVTSNRRLAAKLKNLYKNINNVDLWVGGLAEDHEPGSTLGETFRKIFLSQFLRLRDGDRFWYEKILTPRQIAFVHRQTLSKIIRLNTGVKAQRNVFFASDSCTGVRSFQCQTY